MKYKLILVLLFTLFFSVLRAQTTAVTKHQLSWTGVQKQYLDTLSFKGISFQNAQFPNSNRLPYFNHRITYDPLFSYSTQINNTVYSSLTNEENELFTRISVVSSVPEISTNILASRGSKFLDVTILPFVLQEGKLMKLLSFDLSIIKTSRPKKVSSGPLHTYTANSILAQGKFVKIKIVNSGVYKLTYEDLSSMGISPANVRVFGYGGAVLNQDFMLPKLDDLPEVAISMQKGADGVFNAGDYILFYAQGIQRWKYESIKFMFTHTINSYSNFGYYFVTSDAGEGKKIQDKTWMLPESPEIENVDEFTDYQVHEKDLINLCESGKEFYGEKFIDVTSYNFQFNFPNVVQNNTTFVRLDVAANSTVGSDFSLKLNQDQEKILSLGSVSTGITYTKGVDAHGFFSFTPTSDAFNFKLTYSKPISSSAGYLNYIEVNARRQLKMSGSAMQFQNIDYLGMDTYSRYLLSNANTNVQIWDITDQQNTARMITQTIDNKLTFVAPNTNLNTYLAIDPTAVSTFPKPEIVGVVANQNLHAIAQADMVIITHPDFVTQAEALAKAHREKSLLTVAVMTTDQIYNEFSSGTPDATAYRWALKMLYDRATASGKSTDLPKYLLLFGRGSYDNRGLVPTSGKNNFVLTYQNENSLETTLSYVTDDYFGFMDDNEGQFVPSHLLDLGIGRFPVTTKQQATDVVNKTIGYMNNQGKGNWKNQLCFLADDGDGTLHMGDADAVAESVAELNPHYQINKIYLDAFEQFKSASGETYPLAKSKLQNLISSGVFMLNYAGHGGPSGWSNESILSIADVKALSNKHLPIFVGATCDFSQFDIQQVSAGEHVILNPHGGGIGILSAARPVYASQNKELNKLFCSKLFANNDADNLRVGDVLRDAKNSLGGQINKLSYIYLGDPALKLNYPNKYKIITTKINQSESLANDTLRALSVSTVEGSVVDVNGNKLNNFNGITHVVVYDKIQKITTLNNHKDGSFVFFDRPNTIFSGKAEVKNGSFSISFMLPKDIKYNYGLGRINYYAQDDVNNFEAQGSFENFTIGGTNQNYVTDLDGPSVELFLNSYNFVSGGKVNETPMFMAKVVDKSGINTVGSGIGHDITLTIDSDPTQYYVLNDYYQTSSKGFTDGFLNFKLPEMKDGKHTLSFRVWDLLNNSTTKTLDFEVQKGLTPIIFKVSNFQKAGDPNMHIAVIHDRPEIILNTTVEIFDLSGRKIWSFSQPSVDNIIWDLTANYGAKVKPGVYLYRVSIKTTNSEIFSKTNKMLIVEQ